MYWIINLVLGVVFVVCACLNFLFVSYAALVETRPGKKVFTWFWFMGVFATYSALLVYFGNVLSITVS